MDEASELEAWIGRFVHASLAEDALDRFVEVVDEAILESLPQVAIDIMMVEDLHRSTRHQWLAFLAGLRQPEHGLALPPEAMDLARSLARRGFEVGVLLRVYLSAHHGVFAYLGEAIDQLAKDTPLPEELLRVVWRRADLWMDESVETLIDVFVSERLQEQDTRALRRGEVLEALIAGDEVDAVVARNDLGHPLKAWQTAFVVWTAGAVDQETRSQLQRAATDVARICEDGVLLTHLAGSRDLWCWVATPRPPGPGTFDELTTQRNAGVSIALGTPAPGADGFRSSHLDARAAQRLAMASPHAPRFVDYREFELLCLVLGQEESLERMVLREVGPLCDPGKSLGPVRETVLTYLAHRMNVEATAERLFVHRNTVRYRLNKAEELLGFQLAERPRHIELALQYVALLGPPSAR